MSATGRNLIGNERRADDFYATPAWCTRAILPHLAPGIVLDPCCGSGDVLNVVSDIWRVATFGIEIDADRALAAQGRHPVERVDALSTISWRARWNLYRSVITNPPYSLAMEFILRSMEELPEGECAFLLRLNYLGSQKRASFHREHPADIYILPRRPSFTNGGTDATEYAWFVWGPGRGNRWQILDV